MKFLIIGWDGPDGQKKRPIHRPAHLERLKALEEREQLLLAGPFTNQAGSLIIIEANSLTEAETFAKEDPYFLHGVFERIEIHPFTQVFPDPEST
ncbi:MAG: YciI family protein [Candidatus Binatia bacterium]